MCMATLLGGSPAPAPAPPPRPRPALLWASLSPFRSQRSTWRSVFSSRLCDAGWQGPVGRGDGGTKGWPAQPEPRGCSFCPDRGRGEALGAFPSRARDKGRAEPVKAWGPARPGSGARPDPEWGCEGQGLHRPEDLPPFFTPEATTHPARFPRAWSPAVPKPRPSTGVEAPAAPSPGQGAPPPASETGAAERFGARRALGMLCLATAMGSRGRKGDGGEGAGGAGAAGWVGDSPGLWLPSQLQHPCLHSPLSPAQGPRATRRPTSRVAELAGTPGMGRGSSWTTRSLSAVMGGSRSSGGDGQGGLPPWFPSQPSSLPAAHHCP